MAQGGLKAIATLGALLLASCAETPPPAAEPAPPLVLPPGPPVAGSAPPAGTPQLASSCGASDLQYLVGRSHTEIPPPVDPSRRRVLCSTCVMTPENEPWRQTIIFSSVTGRVTLVACG